MWLEKEKIMEDISDDELKLRSHDSDLPLAIGFIATTQLFFLIIKLFHIIDWRWGWVLLPGMVLLFLGSVMVIAILVNRLFDKINKSNKM
jgi:hypothetical protein